MSKKINLTIIGSGVMGGAITGATFKNHSSWNVAIVDTDLEKLKVLKKKYPLINVSVNAKDIVSKSDVIILAVKPQSFTDLAQEIKIVIPGNVLVISIMAGQSIKKIKKLLGVKKIVRAMPNLGARFLQSTTVWTGENLSKDDKNFTQNLFSTIGSEVYVSKEDFVDKATAVSGSGPGFMAHVIATYIKETMRLGFNQYEANMLVLQTLNATNTLLQKGEFTPEEIVTQVASKGGTTEEGLKVLKKSDLQKVFRNTLKSAYLRAKKLSK